MVLIVQKAVHFTVAATRWRPLQQISPKSNGCCDYAHLLIRGWGCQHLCLQSISPVMLVLEVSTGKCCIRCCFLQLSHMQYTKRARTVLSCQVIASLKGIFSATKTNPTGRGEPFHLCSETHLCFWNPFIFFDRDPQSEIAVLGLKGLLLKTSIYTVLIGSYFCSFPLINKKGRGREQMNIKQNCQLETPASKID